MKQICGVYKFESLENGRFYIGSSKDIHKRKRQHLNRLRAGTHQNIILQRVFNKYGEENLVFTYKLAESEDSARYHEDRLIKKHWSNKLFMNICYGATGGDNMSKNPRRKQIIKQIKDTLHDMVDNMSAQERSDMYSRSGAENGMFGRTHSDSARRKISDSRLSSGGTHLRGIKRSEEGRKNIALSAQRRVAQPDYVNPFKGKTHTKEARRKMSEVNLGWIPANARNCKAAGKIYPSLTEASRQLGVGPATVLYRIRSKNYSDYEYLD